MKIRHPLVSLVLCSAAACCLATAVSAAESAKTITIQSFGCANTYDMADVNEAMRAALATYPGSSADKDKIGSGAGFGGGLRIWPRPRIFVTLEFQRLLASNSGRGSSLGTTYTVDLRVPATSLSMGVGYVFFDRGRARLAISGGVGYYLCTGDLKTQAPGFHDDSNLEGSGFGLHGLGHIFARVTHRLDAEVAGGYRYAKTTDVTNGGFRIRNSDGSLTQIDWGGVTARAGLSLRLAGD
jgi:opacity protein-like surface antigen